MGCSCAANSTCPKGEKQTVTSNSARVSYGLKQKKEIKKKSYSLSECQQTIKVMAYIKHVQQGLHRQAGPNDKARIKHTYRNTSPVSSLE